MNKLEQEFQKIDEFMKTPVKERPKYKQLYEEIQQIAKERESKLHEPRWMTEAYVMMEYRNVLSRVQEEESKEYLEHAKYMTKLALQLYSNE